jgi:hypothetical protein
VTQQRVEDTPIGQPDLEIARRQAEGAHDVDRQRDDLRISSRARLADQVAIELKVLPEPAALLPLVAEQLRDREPADRLPEAVGARRRASWVDTALQRSWQHLRPEDLTAFAFSALRPRWPSRLLGLSHRSMDVKGVLRATPAWGNFRYSIDATFVPH